MEDFAAAFRERQTGALPGHLNIDVLEAVHGLVRARFVVQPFHMAPNGFLHAGAVVTLADTCCGYGSFISKPNGATGFTTIELKTNFLGTARDGAVSCEARLVHGGRNTQVWDAEAKHEETGKTIALFRCSQMMLYPK